MIRPRIIDRELLLKQAEELISGSGATALTFGSLANASGLSKASVQSVFGTREALLHAMLERWIQQEHIRFEHIAGSAPTPAKRIQAHLHSCAHESHEANSRVAAILAALKVSDQPDESAPASWYKTRIGDFSAHSNAERRQRIAFLAAEGAFFVRHMVGLKMSDTLWQEIFQDLEKLAAAEMDAPSPNVIK